MRTGEVACPECGHCESHKLPENLRSGSIIADCEACQEQFVLDFQRFVKFSTRLIRIPKDHEPIVAVAGEMPLSDTDREIPCGADRRQVD